VLRHGRHARALSARGYSVIGVERDTDVIAKARALGAGPTYENVDIRDYRPEPGAFNVAIIMSQSFGHFDAAKNLNVLRQLAMGVREGGRVVLDLWNADFFVAHDAERDLTGNGGIERANMWKAIGSSCICIIQMKLRSRSNGSYSRLSKWI